jgi:hypothetical protein
MLIDEEALESSSSNRQSLLMVTTTNDYQPETKKSRFEDLEDSDEEEAESTELQRYLSHKLPIRGKIFCSLSEMLRFYNQVCYF